MGQDYLTQTYRVRSKIISDPLPQDKTYIFKLFAYHSCNCLFDYFGTLFAPEELEKMEETAHICEIRTYVTLQPLQGICIPRLVHYGTMFECSKEHQSSILGDPFLLMQDAGDVEPEFASLEHYRLALGALENIHHLGIGHLDLHPRNTRPYDIYFRL